MCKMVSKLITSDFSSLLKKKPNFWQEKVFLWKITISNNINGNFEKRPKKIEPGVLTYCAIGIFHVEKNLNVEPLNFIPYMKKNSGK